MQYVPKGKWDLANSRPKAINGKRICLVPIEGMDFDSQKVIIDLHASPEEIGEYGGGAPISTSHALEILKHYSDHWEGGNLFGGFKIYTIDKKFLLGYCGIGL